MKTLSELIAKATKATATNRRKELSLIIMTFIIALISSVFAPLGNEDNSTELFWYPIASLIITFVFILTNNLIWGKGTIKVMAEITIESFENGETSGHDEVIKLMIKSHVLERTTRLENGEYKVLDYIHATLDNQEISYFTLDNKRAKVKYYLLKNMTTEAVYLITNVDLPDYDTALTPGVKFMSASGAPCHPNNLINNVIEVDDNYYWLTDKLDPETTIKLGNLKRTSSTPSHRYCEHPIPTGNIRMLNTEDVGIEHLYIDLRHELPKFKD